MNKLALQFYSNLYGPEGGPWNLSARALKLDYLTTQFFENCFLPECKEGFEVCNVGIGAGVWDRFLSYSVGAKGGALTSVDIDDFCVEQLRECLVFENHPYDVNLVCSDITKMTGCDSRFDIVTMIGSTVLESGHDSAIMLDACNRIMKPGGKLLFMSFGVEESREVFESYCTEHNWKTETAYSEEIGSGSFMLMWAVRKSAR